MERSNACAKEKRNPDGLNYMSGESSYNTSTNPWEANYNNTKNNMVIYYKKLKKYKEIKLTKIKMDLTNLNQKNHTGLARARAYLLRGGYSLEQWMNYLCNPLQYYTITPCPLGKRSGKTIINNIP